MIDDNPHRPPAAEILPSGRGRRHPPGPMLTGLIAIVLATVLLRGLGPVGSVFGVGSWWVSKSWPRPAAPEVPEAWAFLERMESAAPGEAILPESSSSATRDAADDTPGGLRL